ncbi:hypothetical protein QFZ73_000265 [Peribacillus sp. V2I11]|nr:hypothetical protein [Peribacillus sp. V2I11]
MLSKHDSIQRDQLKMITLDQLVPENHMVRKIDAAIDFIFIYDLVKDMYSEVGRLSMIQLFMSPTGHRLNKAQILLYQGCGIFFVF